ncbi:cell division protein ZapA [Jeotgalibaca caeni]|uniref:cell division protein ZapA n=1 Tax=Jeotgalibaca caeni TaxID=3028623 RepID=UPI00237EB35A|nr:cell division protein ZapA [Jeotgalibaca caeni]MDE1549247.1 cell division protein ZapA [Jeotgalibaca caeni]
MLEEKRRFKTTIAGRTYTIVAKKSQEHLQAVSEITNQTILQLKEAMPSLDIEQRSILVAVNTISENLTKQAEIDALKEENAALEKKIEQLRRRIQTLQNQTKEKKVEGTVKEEKSESAPVTKKPKTKFVRPTTAAAVMLQKESQKEMSSSFIGTQGMPEASKKKLENKAAQMKGPLENR